MFTPHTDIERVAECAEVFRPIAGLLVTTIEWMLTAKGRNGIHVRISEAFRSPERQLERWRQGRALTERGWEVIDAKQVVTNNRPAAAAHCIVDTHGKPASLAVDVWLLDSETGKLLADEHPAWALVPAAAYLVGEQRVRCGAFWSHPRDWPHVELAGWGQLVTHGVLKET